MLPFQTFKKTKRDKAHQVSFVLKEGQILIKAHSNLKHLIETHRNTWGNAYINIHWGVDGRPKELWVLNPAVTTPTVDLKTNKLWYFTSLPDGYKNT